MNRAAKTFNLETRTGSWRKKAKFYRLWIRGFRKAIDLKKQAEIPGWGQW